MNITLANFQIKAVEKLMEVMVSEQREIVLKSCTGSGKTIILTHFMDEFQKSYPDIVFIWLTPGKGNLEEQSKAKMDRYINGSKTKLLSDVMLSGFEGGDACFFNWEKLIKKSNKALRESEHTNLLEHIEKAYDSELKFIVIVDESHHNDTVKGDDIIELFNTKKIIRCSATPKIYPDALNIYIPEEDVIAEGLIKKLLIINEDFPQNINVDDQVAYLLEQALKKQNDLKRAYMQRNVNVNPLIIVQIPNKSELLLDQVERYYESRNITYDNNLLAVWLANKKQNLDNIEQIDSEIIVVIIKQAVATGWDCPRAQILVKLRDNMSETFEIQTIGRIRRMPEAKHYESDVLDSCYLYTLDEKFSTGVRMNLGNRALEAVRLFLKSEHRSFSLISEKKTSLPFPRDALLMLRIVAYYFEEKYNLNSGTENKKLLEIAGYSFSTNIVEVTRSGTVSVLSQDMFDDLNKIFIYEKLDTHKHGRDYHHCVSEIGLKIGVPYNTINTMIQRLFCQTVKNDKKILCLEVRRLYAFVINNKHLLMHDFVDAMASTVMLQNITSQTIIETLFYLPQEALITYNAYAKVQKVMHKNVYRGYLSSAEPRSSSEVLFEKHCEISPKISWYYKNGDKGEEYFSIVYEDNFGKQKLFYPDYIVGDSDGSIWIIETKGGFSRDGESEDIDKYTEKKFLVLKTYLDKHGLLGGIVRQDKSSMELLICMENYNDNVSSQDWQLITQYL